MKARRLSRCVGKCAACGKRQPLIAKGMCESCYRKDRAKRAGGWYRRLDEPRGDDGPPPDRDPLADARAQSAARRDESVAKSALKAAVSRIEVLERQIDTLTTRAAKPLSHVVPVELRRGSRQAAAIAVLSDVHAGAVVLPSESTYWNRYNQTICEYRLGRWFAGVEWLVQSYRDGKGEYAWQIPTLIVLGLGDIVDGHLHEDNKETSQTAIQTLTWVEPILVDGFERLAKLKFDRMLVDWSYGNHGRDSLRPQRATGAVHSHEYGLGVRLERWLRGSKIEVHCPPKPHHYLDVFGRKIHTHHGDEIQYAGGVGGISIPINKAVNQWNRVCPARYHFFGHYHQQLDHGDWFANGSVIGYNDFAMSIKATPEEPQQTFALIDAKRGKTAVSPIWVSDREAEAAL